MSIKSHEKNRRLVGIALFSVLVVILQAIADFVRIGPAQLSISLVSLPIVVGAAVYGVSAGFWLGFVFSWAVILSPNTLAFLNFSFLGTVITVFVKGIACGCAAGIVYKSLRKVDYSLAAVMSALVCPILNTGIFLLGCRLFFYDLVMQWTGGVNTLWGMIVGLVGVNFLIEFGSTVVLSPVILRLIRIGRKEKEA